MGFEQRRIEVVVSLSKHNSGQDIIDELLYEHLSEKINTLIHKEEYKSLNPTLI